MQKLIDFYKLLDGKKTYIIVAIISILNLAVAFGWLPHEVIENFDYILVALGLGALRSGVAKSSQVTI